MGKYILGNKAKHYSCIASGVVFTPGVPQELANLSWRTKIALRNKVIIPYEEPLEPVVPIDPVVPETKSLVTFTDDDLLSMTRVEIMKVYDFLDPEDTASAEKCSTKRDLVTFLRSVEEDYQ
jgi:hypothetical protein